MIHAMLKFHSIYYETQLTSEKRASEISRNFPLVLGKQRAKENPVYRINLVKPPNKHQEYKTTRQIRLRYGKVIAFCCGLE